MADLETLAGGGRADYSDCDEWEARFWRGRGLAPAPERLTAVQAALAAALEG